MHRASKRDVRAGIQGYHRSLGWRSGSEIRCGNWNPHKAVTIISVGKQKLRPRQWPTRRSLEVLDGNFLERQRQRRLIGCGSPLKSDIDAKVGQRPWQIDANAELCE